MGRPCSGHGIGFYFLWLCFQLMFTGRLLTGGQVHPGLSPCILVTPISLRTLRRVESAAHAHVSIHWGVQSRARSKRPQNHVWRGTLEEVRIKDEGEQRGGEDAPLDPSVRSSSPNLRAPKVHAAPTASNLVSAGLWLSACKPEGDGAGPLQPLDPRSLHKGHGPSVSSLGL